MKHTAPKLRLFIVFPPFLLLLFLLLFSSHYNRNQNTFRNAMQSSFCSQLLLDAILEHHEQEEPNHTNLNQDAIICAGVWFDYRESTASLYIVGGPTDPAEISYSNSDVHFLGYYKDKDFFISFVSIGHHKEDINVLLNIDRLNNNYQKYLTEIDSYITNYSEENRCSWLVSIYTITNNNRLSFLKREIRR